MLEGETGATGPTAADVRGTEGKAVNLLFAGGTWPALHWEEMDPKEKPSELLENAEKLVIIAVEK